MSTMRESNLPRGHRWTHESPAWRDTCCYCWSWNYLLTFTGSRPSSPGRLSPELISTRRNLGREEAELGGVVCKEADLARAPCAGVAHAFAEPLRVQPQLDDAVRKDAVEASHAGGPHYEIPLICRVLFVCRTSALDKRVFTVYWLFAECYGSSHSANRLFVECPTECTRRSFCHTANIRFTIVPYTHSAHQGAIPSGQCKPAR